ncbi:hypothetical protein SLS57_002656 [Botryosphaeria dothidea]
MSSHNIDEDKESGHSSRTSSIQQRAGDEEKQQDNPTGSTDQSITDPNIIDWDGLNDPENPMNWTEKKKWTNIGLMSFITLVTPLASSMLGPGIPNILADFDIHSNILASFVLSIYVLGFAVGPMIIAPMSEMVFWLLTIAAGVVTIVCFLFLRETYAPIILSYKVARLRKETNNPDLRSALAPENPLPPRALFMHSILRPLQMLTRSLIIFLMALYASVIYGLLYLLFTTFTFVFEGAYGFSSGTVGLTYLGIGVGMLFGLVFMGFTSDRVIKRAMQRGETLTPEHRLPLWLVVPPALLLPVGLLIYGWTTEYAESVHWIVPMLGTALFGFGMISLMTYLVDAFTTHAASVMAALTLLRSLFGAFLPLAGLDMYDALGLGWGNSLLAFIALAMVPVPVVFSLFGERIRNSSVGKAEF